jgi:hypothetical protein
MKTLRGFLVAIALVMVVGITWSDETTTTRGYVDGERVKTTTTTKSDGSTRTRGYIGGERVKTKSITTAAGTKTTGYIGNKRVRVKTKPE